MNQPPTELHFQETARHLLTQYYFEADDVDISEETPVDFIPDENGAWVTVRVWIHERELRDEDYE
jgi:hypothetical protein